jgi:hypothetical protein
VALVSAPYTLCRFNFPWTHGGTQASSLCHLGVPSTVLATLGEYLAQECAEWVRGSGLNLSQGSRVRQDRQRDPEESASTELTACSWAGPSREASRCLAPLEVSGMATVRAKL